LRRLLGRSDHEPRFRAVRRRRGRCAAWQARVDLAAAHRLADRQGLSEGIFNHFTLAVPETGDRYLQIPFALHWSEVTASCFLEIGYDERVLSGAGDIER
jgi:ribulose-5-phosphate 4-epimerase/fuculose-1-phosphate aldolase